MATKGVSLPIPLAASSLVLLQRSVTPIAVTVTDSPPSEITAGDTPPSVAPIIPSVRCKVTTGKGTKPIPSSEPPAPSAALGSELPRSSPSDTTP